MIKGIIKQICKAVYFHTGCKKVIGVKAATFKNKLDEWLKGTLDIHRIDMNNIRVGKTRMQIK